MLEEPQHKGRLGEAFVYDVHRMSLLGKSKTTQSQYLSRARTWLLRFLLRKEGALSTPARQVLSTPWGGFHELHLRRQRLAWESRVRQRLSALRTSGCTGQ